MAERQLPPWPLELERTTWAAICRPRSGHRHAYYFFARVVLGIDRYMALPGKKKRWFRTGTHLPLCDAIQQQVEGWLVNRLSPEATDRARMCLCIHRNTGKTVLGTKGALAWMMLADPNITAVIGSETQPKASRFLKPLRTLWEGSDATSSWVALYGDWSPTDPTAAWNANELTHRYKTTTTESEPSIGTFGVGGGITGYHPDVLFYDDPISEEKIRDEENWITRANESYDSILNAVQASGCVFLIGTRYRDNDVIGSVLQSEGVGVWEGMPNIWPTISVSPEKPWRMYFLQARGADNTPSTPWIWSEAELTDRENRNRRFYATQMMNDPAAVADSPLTQSYIDSLQIATLPETATTATIHADTAFRDETRKKKGDESVLITFLHQNDKSGNVIFDQGYGSARWRSSDFITQFIQILKDLQRRKIRVKCVTDEQLPGGKTGPFWELVREKVRAANLQMPRVIVVTRQGTTKVRRIEDAIGYWLTGYVRLRQHAPGIPQLTNQLLRSGVSAHDDWADAAADVFHPSVWTRPRTPRHTPAPAPSTPQDAYVRSGGQYNPFQLAAGRYINDPIQ